MLKINVLTLLSVLMLCTICIGRAPAFAQEQSGSSNLPKHYLAQNDQSESDEEQAESDDSGQAQEADQQSESTEATESTETTTSESPGPAGPFTSLINLIMGEGTGQPVSLATLFVQAIGMGILIVIVVAIPISFNCAFCALIWKIGMVARGGKKPDVG